MAVRIKDWMIPYTGGIGIEITNNHVINVLLRKLNNLIHVNENRELYVDLQLDDWIQPDDDFPVGVTTGRILQEDWWPQSGLILNWKTTSGDYARLIYANDWNVYIDIGDGNWMLLWGPDIITKLGNCKAFFLANNSDLTTGQEALDWYLAWRYPIIVEWNQTYVLDNAYQEWDDWNIRFIDTHTTVYHQLDRWQSTVLQYRKYIFYENNEVTRIGEDSVAVSPYVLDTTVEYQTPYMPLYDWSPTTKYYVDQELLKKQDILTPWTRITIQTDPNTGDLVISADVSGVMTYMWNVTDASQLPTTGQNQWDCWYSELEKTLYAWDGTQWNDIGGTGIDLTNYFNMQVNDSDDIIEGSTHLFVTQTEKNTWNGKQNPIRAWQNITIDSDGVTINAIDTTYTAWDGININVNNVISNTAKFDPSNAGSMWQFLKKTNDGYQWADIPWWGWTSYTAWDWININNSNVISNTKPFDPTNAWSIGQVLKKSGDNTYYWANEGGGWWWNFYPENTWNVWQVLTKTSTWYDWEDLTSADWNIKLFTINSESDVTIDQSVIREAISWYNQWKLPILRWYKTWGELNSKGWRFFTPSEFGKIQRSGQINDYLTFTAPYNDTDYTIDTVEWVTRMAIPQVKVEYNWNTIISAWLGWASALWSDFLSTTNNYSTPYTPRYDGSPATKKYVDDRNWVGTQAQYNQLTPVNWVIYNIIPSS